MAQVANHPNKQVCNVLMDAQLYHRMKMQAQKEDLTLSQYVRRAVKAQLDNTQRK